MWSYPITRTLAPEVMKFIILATHSLFNITTFRCTMYLIYAREERRRFLKNTSIFPILF